MTGKQKKFIAEYLVDLNGTQAAIRAGYSHKTANEQASRLLANVNIKEQVQQLMNKRAEKTEVTAEQVLKNIKEIHAICIEKGEHNTALKALELQGKHLKLFTEKVEHSGAVVHTHKFEKMSDEELDAEIKQLNKITR